MQFPGWEFDKKLMHNDMADLLDFVWQVHQKHFVLKPTETWRRLDGDNFVTFIERLASSSHGGSQKETILSELHRKLKELFFDPFRPYPTLQQLVPF